MTGRLTHLGLTCGLGLFWSWLLLFGPLGALLFGAAVVLAALSLALCRHEAGDLDE